MADPIVWLVDERTNPDTTYTLANVAAALKQQANNEFKNAWGFGVADVKTDTAKHNAPDWMIHIVDVADLGLGYHTIESDDQGQDQVVGYVSAGVGYTGWPITASHELLEMLGDPNVDQCDPVPNAGYGIMQEVGDPVENSSYEITVGGASIPVSDFVFPSWFGLSSGTQTQFDYLDVAPAPFTLGADGGYTISCTPQGGMSIQQFEPAFRPGSDKKAPLPPGPFRGRKNQFTWMLFTPRMRRMFRRWKGGLAEHPQHTLAGFGFVIHPDPSRSSGDGGNSKPASAVQSPSGAGGRQGKAPARAK